MDYGRMDMVNGNYMEENNRRMAEEEQRRKAEEERRRLRSSGWKNSAGGRAAHGCYAREFSFFRMGQRGVCPVLHILSV